MGLLDAMSGGCLRRMSRGVAVAEAVAEDRKMSLGQ